MPTPVIAIFDIGKTNKKIILFDEQYNLIDEQSKEFQEITDENGDACEDIDALSLWVKDTLATLLLREDLVIKAINVSAYGASFVHLDEQFKIVTPLYNYLKPYPKQLEEKFYQTYGGMAKVTRETASPVLGSLNSGLQLYRIKHESPEVYSRIKYSLHLPQYISHLITGKVYSEITSIGCHTHLWDFEKRKYHAWVLNEGIENKFPPIMKSDQGLSIKFGSGGKKIIAGSGLHDSSAALIPYIDAFPKPFVLISTGTWCITLNPFNTSPLTEAELDRDCLCYLSYHGKPVKASRIFAGNDHEIQIKRMATHFKKKKDYYKAISFNPALVTALRSTHKVQHSFISASGFQAEAVNLSVFSTYEEAYHKLIMDIVERQKISTELVLKNSPAKKIFVDGGFSKNPLFMHLLARAFPQCEVYGATISQATALGAALAIHGFWNKATISKNLIGLKHYAQ